MGLGAGDVVIVGGGPAGATTAIALAQLAPGLLSRVVVLEKAVFPRDKYCAGAIGRRGDRILEDLDASPDVPSAPIDGIAFRCGGGQIEARPGRIGRVIRRIEFDHALVRTAIARGVRVQDGVRVVSVRASDGGAEVETSKGTIRAAVVVGADGVGSVVRRAMGMGPGPLRAQVLEVDTEPVAGDLDRGLLLFDATDRRLAGYFWDFPTLVDGHALVCRGVYWLAIGEGRVEIETLLAQRLARMGLDLAACTNKRFAERGFEPTARFAQGPMMLVGEAAGIDPVTGEGIPQAIEAGAMAARFVAQTVAAGGPVESWNDVVRRSRLFRDLSIRHRGIRAFYGPGRPTLERFLLDCPAMLEIGCQHFAHEPVDRLKLAQVLLRGGARLLGFRARRLFAQG